MKRYIIILSMVLIPLVGLCQTKNQIKAKLVVKTYITNHKDKFKNYSPISFSKVDSLFTVPEENENIRSAYKKAMAAKEKAGLSKRDISLDMKELIEEMESNRDMYDKQTILDCKSYSVYRDLFYKMVDNFVPKFIGWKIVHTYKSSGTITKTEFRLDKSSSYVTDYINK